MKAILRLGYLDYILPAEEAVKIMGLLEGAERWESKYHKTTPTQAAHHTYHVYSEEAGAEVKNLELVSESMYRMAKLAGKPEDK